MTTYPLPTLAAQITATGVSAPSFADILASLQATYRGIYGSDVYLEADSQDGQFLASMAAAFHDVNNAVKAAYNAFSPATAQGAGLASVVKINGLTKGVASNSTATVTLVGQAYTVIGNGKVTDAAGNVWSLPSTVEIPIGGSIAVTATCDTPGAISAAAGAITGIATPTLGWQTVTNAADATPGNPVETDAKLRQRQSISTGQPALTAFDAMIAQVAEVAGVTRYAAYENDTNSADGNGLPAHSVTFVVEGGADTDVASALISKKTPGGFTNGTTSVLVTDAKGVARTIRFYRRTNVSIQVSLTVKALSGYTSIVGDEIKAALVDYINALPIGADVLLTRLYVPAQLSGAADSQTFELVSLQVGKNYALAGSADITIAFNEAATAIVADVALSVIS